MLNRNIFFLKELKLKPDKFGEKVSTKSDFHLIDIVRKSFDEYKRFEIYLFTTYIGKIFTTRSIFSRNLYAAS